MEVKPIDSISSYEFSKIFDRTTDYVDLEGKGTVSEIEKTLWRVREYCRQRYQKAETAAERARFKAAKMAYDNLLQHGFARRAIREALLEPEGFVALTLRFGKVEAKQRSLAQRRTQARFYGRPDHWRRR
jgi:hypothetical protein